MVENLVVGSGVMGRWIAYVGVTGELNVTFVDVNSATLDNAEQEI